MSIIIRLQNLPWSANAMDIRQFFSGLQIPEGGVHIVGGELGDAFIAFSTDEDARQAFLRTDGNIKGIQIKLMLSSRTEMQRVIEQARTQSMAAFMLPSTPAVQPIQAPLPAAVPPMMPAAVPEIQKEPKERDDNQSERKRDRRRSRSKSRDRRDRSRDRRDRRHRDRSRSKSRDRRDRRRGRDRSRSRNRSRDKDTRGRRDRTKSTDKREDKEVAPPFQKDPKKVLPEIWNNRPQVPQPKLNIIPPVGLANEGPGLIAPSPWGLGTAVKTNFVANMAANLHARGPNGFQAANAQPRDSGFGANTQARETRFGPPNLPARDTGFGSNPQASGSGFGVNPQARDTAFGANPQARDTGFGTHPQTRDTGFGANLQTRDIGFGAKPQTRDFGFGAKPLMRDTRFGNNAPNQGQSRARESWPPANPPSVRESFGGSPTDYPAPPILNANNRGMRDDIRGPRGDMHGPIEDIRSPRGDMRGSFEDIRGLWGDMNGPKDNLRDARSDIIDLRDDDNSSPRDDFRGPKGDMRGPKEFRDNKRGAKEDVRSSRDVAPSPKNDLRSEIIARRARLQDTGTTKENNGKRSRFEDADIPVNACVALEQFYGSYGDLRRFFNGLSINYKGIKVINDEYGHKTGVCFVQFRDEGNKNKAIKMNGRNLNNANIRIKHISDKVFEEAIDRYNPRMDEINPYEDHLGRTRNTKKFLSNEPEIKDFLCLKVEDLPTFVKEQDILHIFSQHPLISLHLNFKPKGGTIAYVKFSSKEVAKLALDEKSHHIIRGKPVTVKPCKDEEFNEVNLSQVEALEEPKPKDIGTDCLSISKLPSKTNDRDISDFFSDIGVIPMKIHLMSNNIGFTGQAYCEFESKEEVVRAKTKNNALLGQNTISVEPILRGEMESILGNTLPHPGVVPGQPLAPGTPLPPIKPDIPSLTKPDIPIVVNPPAEINSEPPPQEKAVSPVNKAVEAPAVQLLTEPPKEEPPSDENQTEELNEFKEDNKAPSLEHTNPPPRPLMPERLQTIKNRDDFNGRRFNDFHKRPDYNNEYERPREYNGPRSSFDKPGDHFDDPRGNFDGPRSGFDGPRQTNDRNFGSRDDFQGHRGGDFGSRGDFGKRGGPRGNNRFGGRGGSRFNPQRNDSPVDDERPGCTVYMDNVPYKASTNDILDFFDGYHATDNVSRRYNSNNTPSAEAKVTFFNPEDAFRAVRELNGQPIWGRAIYLTQH